MVCYLLYGPRRQQTHNQCTGTPPSSIPSSPMPGHVSSSCPCDICNRVSPHSPERSTNVPTPVYQRPTHRRVISESDIVQPKPMFRKFCLDVLSATLLSPSVILLSLKYIQQLMKNLKESNKIVNTGDGAEYRFFTGALILANKFLDDNTFTNKTWADITGMKIKDVNHLEMQFLNGIDFRLFTSPQSYSEWLANLTQFTSVYMPSQHSVASHHQAAAAQSPISPMDTTTMFSEQCSIRQPTSGSDSRQSTLSCSMGPITQYIESVRQLQQKSSSTTGRYQRVPSQQFASLPHPTHGLHNSQQLPSVYQQEAQDTVHRKRSAVIAFDDAMEQSPGYDMGSLPHPNNTPIRRPSHKRFSSSSSLATMMSMTSTQDSFQYNGPSPSMSQQQRYQHRSNRASSGSLSLPFRGHHQRSVSGGYYIDMTGHASSYKESSHLNLPMPNTFSRPGVHPLDKDQELGHRPSSRTEAYHSAHQLHYGSMPSSGNRSQPYHPSTPPQYSPNRCESACGSMGCGSNMDAVTNTNFNVDPHLWSPLEGLKLYNITTQAAKRVVAQSKALSSSANTLHMYYPTTLA
ncbi:hypothetical protein BGZ76_011478 [Entomortierella beljakovae]|nr:hypothetical protein BGZ76_011478 [Entomortierella beljakovae]